jgi:hypothetical protein
MRLQHSVASKRQFPLPYPQIIDVESALSKACSILFCCCRKTGNLPKINFKQRITEKLGREWRPNTVQIHRRASRRNEYTLPKIRLVLFPIVPRQTNDSDYSADVNVLFDRVIYRGGWN